MTEAEWNACTDTIPMIDFIRSKNGPKLTDRKLRLFSVACSRRIWNLLTDERSRRTVEVAELLVDGRAPQKQLLKAQKETRAAEISASTEQPAYFAALVASNTVAAFPDVMFSARTAEEAARFNPMEDNERAVQCGLLREILGPAPFRKLSIDKAVRTTPVQRLAQVIYDERAFDRMPILADALEEAGCTDQDVIEHSRGPGPHVRGCWVVDLLLGKE